MFAFPTATIKAAIDQVPGLAAASGGAGTELNFSATMPRRLDFGDSVERLANSGPDNRLCE